MKEDQKRIVIALWNITAKDDLLDRTATEILGINHTDNQALAALINLGVLPVGHISELLCLTTGASTALIDRLEKSGYARRLNDKTDRRRVLVEATDKGFAASDNLYGVLTERLSNLLNEYTPSELKVIEKFLIKAGDLFAERVEELNGEIKNNGS
jgi:DNA-binding MarR family transcriptional regulator